MNELLYIKISPCRLVTHQKIFLRGRGSGMKQIVFLGLPCHKCMIDSSARMNLICRCRPGVSRSGWPAGPAVYPVTGLSEWSAIVWRGVSNWRSPWLPWTRQLTPQGCQNLHRLLDYLNTKFYTRQVIVYNTLPCDGIKVMAFGEFAWYIFAFHGKSKFVRFIGGPGPQTLRPPALRHLKWG